MDRVKPERWAPVRHVPRGVACDFCWRAIAKGARAEHCPTRNVYECLPCREEAARAEAMRGVLNVGKEG